MPSATGRFRRSDRILRSREFRHVMRRGERSASRSFVVFVDDINDSGPRRTRLGITVSKKVGNAVVRNRVKRRIREWFRNVRGKLPAGSELVVIARRPARDLSTPVLFEELDRTVRRGCAV